MKIEIPLLAGLLLVGTDLLARAAVQGVEQALLSTTIEYAWKAIKTISKFLPETGRRPCFVGR
jgi:hypothetical protein